MNGNNSLLVFLQLLYAFGLTAIIEGSLIFLMTKNKKCVYHSIFCNLITNPLLNILLMFGILGSGAYVNGIPSVQMISLEVIVVLIEAFIYYLYKDFKYGKALLISFALNVCSVGIGMIMNTLI